jgi:membrane-bound lytic murein transglycosylase C
MKKIFLIVSLISIIFADDFNQFVDEFNQYERNTQKEFSAYQKELNDGFNEYKQELNKGFAEYKKELSKYWKNPELSSKKVFVEYSNDKTTKKRVDYDKQEIEIDVIAKNEQQAKQKIVKSLYSLVNETTKRAFDNNPVLVKVNKSLSSNKKLSPLIKVTKPSNEPIVADMVFKKPPTQKEAINYSINSVKQHKIVKEKSKVPNTYVYKLKIKLPPKAFLAKAKIYKNDVLNRAYKFRLTPALVYAIIHTESSFNPMARSYVPAFGLMQIVPQTAGADAYKMLYGQKKILAPSYLYNSHNNILIGSAYLKKIYYGYMRKIKDPVSRLYCSIAAYNTGAGNVACAFNSTSKDSSGRTKCIRSKGDYNIIKASDKINKLTSDEVYNYLLKNLRYDEPKNYLKRVTKRMLIYKKALSSNAL